MPNDDSRQWLVTLSGTAAAVFVVWFAVGVARCDVHPVSALLLVPAALVGLIVYALRANAMLALVCAVAVAAVLSMLGLFLFGAYCAR
jgi:hypothetical protein